MLHNSYTLFALSTSIYLYAQKLMVIVVRQHQQNMSFTELTFKPSNKKREKLKNRQIQELEWIRFAPEQWVSRNATEKRKRSHNE